MSRLIFMRKSRLSHHLKLFFLRGAVLWLALSSGLVSSSRGAEAGNPCDGGVSVTLRRLLNSPPRPLSYDEYLEFKKLHIDRLDNADLMAADPVVTQFYRENYKGRNILIFADDDFNQSSGVAIVMGILKERIEKKTGLNVVFVTPKMFKKSIELKLQGQTFQQAIPTDREISEMISRYQPAAVHVMAELVVGNRARASLIKHGVPFTTAIHTEWAKTISSRLKSQYLKPMRPVVEEMVNTYLRAFHGASQGVMVPSDSLLDKLIASRFKTENLRPWSHGVNLELFRPELRDETLYPKLATQQGKVAKPPYVIMVSRFSAEKNVHDFLDAQTDSGTKFFIGPGVTDAVKKKYSNVVFLGNKDNKTELPALYASADVFVFPGTNETLGLVNGEALASGTPVVAYNVQGPKDVIKDPKAGILVPYDENDRAGNIQRLSDAIPRTLQLSRTDVREYAEGLSWDRSVSEFLEFLYPLTPEHLNRVQKR